MATDHPSTDRHSTNRPSTAEKRRRFRQLHERGCFVLPNPWDVGSARWLQGLGFPALASTSAGLAWALGAADNRITRQQVLDHLQDLVAAHRPAGECRLRERLRHRRRRRGRQRAPGCGHRRGRAVDRGFDR